MSKNCVTYIHRTVWKWHSIWMHIYWHFGHIYYHLDTNITIWIYILQFGHIYCNLDINMETRHIYIYDFSTYWSCLTSIVYGPSTNRTGQKFKGKKRGTVFYITDREDEVTGSKIFMISLCVPDRFANDLYSHRLRNASNFWPLRTMFWCTSKAKQVSLELFLGH